MKLYKTLLTILLAVLFVACRDHYDTPKSNEKQLIKFSVDDINAVIDETAKTIKLTLPAGSDLNNVKPFVQVSDRRASVYPASGTEQDFTNPVKYTVTAEDGTQQEYTVTLTLAKSSDKDVLEFLISGELKNIRGSINSVTKTISVVVPAETDVTKLKPVVNISPKATVSPASGAEQDFTNPVIYTVTAQDGSKQEFSVIVKDEIANATPRLVNKIRITEDRNRPYRYLGYDNKDRLVRYTETAPDRPFEVKDMDVIQIAYSDDGKIIKITKTINAETATSYTRILDVIYPDNKTIHVTEQLTSTLSKLDVITLNEVGKVSKFAEAGKTELFEYDKAGNLIKLTDTDGAYKIITYDNKNGVFKDGNTPQWIWLYTTGQLIGVGPNNHLSVKEYTSGGQLTETIDYTYNYEPFSWYPNAYWYKKGNDKIYRIMYYK